MNANLIWPTVREDNKGGALRYKKSISYRQAVYDAVKLRLEQIVITNPNEELKRLLDAVGTMRLEQRRYQQSRSPQALTAANRWEKEVDKQVKRLYAMSYDPKQETMKI